MGSESIRGYVLKGIGKVAVAIVLLVSAWAVGRAQGSAHPEFQIVITASGPGQKDVSFICQKGCNWNVTNLGCGVRRCSYSLDARNGLHRAGG
jgi:hypothetical protein